MSTLAGAVLVGGRSTRMGRDKALVEVGGVAMAERVARVLEAAGCDPVVVVGGADRVPGRAFVPDRFPDEGPLGGVLTALEAAAADRLVVVACDLPWLDAATIARLVADQRPADVVCARTDRREPLCAVWRPSALPVLVAAFERGERALHRVGELTWAEVAVASGPLVNVNTPEDLAKGVSGDPGQ